MPVDLDRAGPVNDNRPAIIKRANQKNGDHRGDTGYVLPKGEAMPMRMSHYPQATGLPGELHILEHPGREKSLIHGIPGILNMTSLGPDQRHRLADGIIDLSARKTHDMEGPVHRVTGHDATAMNAGMRPIPGAPIHGDHHSKHHSKHHEEHHGTHKGEMRKTARRAYE
jgi:hypothetical protein